MINKTLFKLSLYIGLFILLIGVFFKINSSSSFGTLFTKSSGIVSNRINGTGYIALSFMILFFSFLMYKNYKSEKKERKNRIDKERREEKKLKK
ncbi:hypothetical protein [Flavobacterium sp.]|jgi:adenine-specific DNA methylase|uniref:hypothetical protein n=1 Tax=Flavobacterium sp. TaxID=239 RepID=UPI002A822D52|nr:hypothetical protein [Flavobacterium sp.]